MSSGERRKTSIAGEAAVLAIDNTEIQANEGGKARKQITKKLATGQKIAITANDERTLRTVYEYLSGFSSRQSIESTLEDKRSEVNRLYNTLPPSAKLSLQISNQNMYLDMKGKDTNNVSNNQDNAEGKTEDAIQDSTVDNNNKSESDILLDDYYKAKEQLHKLEEKLKAHAAVDHKISFKDLDTMLKMLGTTLNRRQIEVC